MELMEWVEELNDGVPFDQRVVITPFFVVAGPDYEAMLQAGCPVSLPSLPTSLPPSPSLSPCPPPAIPIACCCLSSSFRLRLCYRRFSGAEFRRGEEVLPLLSPIGGGGVAFSAPWAGADGGKGAPSCLRQGKRWHPLLPWGERR